MTQTAQPTPAAPSEDVVPGAEVYTPEFRADPYPVYARLRAERPVVKVRTSSRASSSRLSRWPALLARIRPPTEGVGSIGS